MARTFTPEVNKHVKVFIQVGSVFKWRTLTITNVDSATQVDGRYGRVASPTNLTKATVTARKTLNQWSVQ